MELNDFEQHVVDHIIRSQAPGKHAARSAIRHLERGWELVNDMPELAYFSAITAEEESATAVFHALKRRRYIGASSLNVKNHLHKTALHPFLLSIGRHFAGLRETHDPKLEFNTQLSPQGNELLRVRMTVKDTNDEDIWAYPLPPLEFVTTLNGKLYAFENELSDLAKEKNAEDIFKHIKRLANRRNQVLYAASDGIAHIEKDPFKFMNYRKSVVFSHFMLYLLIDPYTEHQSFVQQSLEAFLRMLRIIGNRTDEI